MSYPKFKKATLNRVKTSSAALLGISLAGVLLASGVADAATSSTTTSTSSLPAIIAKGDQAISDRLTTLNNLTTKINDAQRLTANDKSVLSNEVSSSISGLTSLKTQLDGETTVAAAKADVTSIFTTYRVYALVAPKVNLVKVADDQQVVEADLQSLAQKLQARITADQAAGKSVGSLQTDLQNMTTETAAAQTISTNIESAVINLVPGDYNQNHSVLSGDNTQLKTAHSDNQTATQDSKTIVSGLKAIK